jgi:hypothetical protein
LAIAGTTTLTIIIFHSGKTPASPGNHRLSFKSLKNVLKKNNNIYAVRTANRKMNGLFEAWNMKLIVVKRNPIQGYARKKMK